MELFSQPFIQAVYQTLSSPETIVLGTIPPQKGKPLALVGEIWGRPDMKVFSAPAEAELPMSAIMSSHLGLPRCFPDLLGTAASPGPAGSV
ncbi:Cancer-related nucleoside-triphosphatase-like protein [Sciurus carolinensis]|uniref:Cancer-related nucleoside-triphosphatase-like protein n=1 Tax=Sciurus carolinensis TaxID=30640 RepID=A0AA41SUI1_SCICA|nr:Cancer-related nucleoside-triphosphatase-like protein [Sciurus carolinensis]